jgi:hypothetical protein
MCFRQARFFRAAVAVVIALAWFTGTHHCLLGLLEGLQNTASEMCPHCSGHCTAHETRDKAPSSMLACCQGLLSPGLELAQAKLKFAPVLLGLQSPSVDRPIRFETLQRAGLSAEYETGPPRESCFVATVLKRSLRENAPPLPV